MNRKVKVLVGLVVISLAGAAMYWWMVANNSSAQSAALELYGNVDIREVRLAFNGSEHVAEILVEEGDKVQAGQVLARLHTERLQAEMQRVRAQVEAAKAEAKSAELSYKRIKSLLKLKLAAQDQTDIAEAKSHAAIAQVHAAEAVLAQTQQILKDTQLYAPDNGVIRDRIVEPGDFVTPQTPVLTLALLDPVWVRAYLPETYLGRVKPGAPVSISTDSFADKIYQGWVGSISPTAEFTPKNVETPELRSTLVYQVRIFVCNPQFELHLGMPATVSINLEATADVGQAEHRCDKSAPATVKP